MDTTSLVEVRARLATTALAVRERARGPLPRSDHGVRLDPGIHTLLGVLDAFDKGGPPFDLGKSRRALRLAPLLDFPRRALAAVSDRELPGPGGPLAIRVYDPEPAAALPILVYLHGGGFALGDLDSHDGICRTLASEARCVVVAVAYRLAPEHPFPAAVDDAEAAFVWVREHAAALGGRPDRVAIGGDSAGGNLGALACMRLRDAGVAPPYLQALVYPASDLRRVLPSHERFAAGFFLTAAKIRWYVSLYLEDPTLAYDACASPLLGQMQDLPPAIIHTAGFDPLRDEGVAYAEALAAAGVPTVHRCHHDLIHGYFSFGGVVPAARVACLSFADALRVALHRP